MGRSGLHLSVGVVDSVSLRVMAVLGGVYLVR